MSSAPADRMSPRISDSKYKTFHSESNACCDVSRNVAWSCCYAPTGQQPGRLHPSCRGTGALHPSCSRPIWMRMEILSHCLAKTGHTSLNLRREPEHVDAERKSYAGLICRSEAQSPRIPSKASQIPHNTDRLPTFRIVHLNGEPFAVGRGGLMRKAKARIALRHR
jgi:hypothetical protein